jgi:cell division protein ZapA
MPDLEITIGGRVFQVACQTGEEGFLRAAAQMLDAETAPLVAQMGRMPEARMLLMAGLMLADKTAALEDDVRTLRARLADREGPAGQKAGLPGSSKGVTEAMAEIAARSEALAAAIEERIARHG